MKTKLLIITCIGISFIIGFGYGLLSYKFELFPVPLIRYVKEYSLDDGIDTVGFQDIANKTSFDCGQLPEKTAIILTIGQSNAANHGEIRYSPKKEIYNFNFFDGKCYRAKDPLLGATGRGGSVWSRLGDLLVEQKEFPAVVIAPIGVNASSVLRWQPGGDLNPRIHKALAGLKAAGLKVTHILWHQGEADAMQKMEANKYASALNKIISDIRLIGIEAPIFVGITSMCHNPGSIEIRHAQASIPKQNNNVFQGANSDLLDKMSLRYDGCHFSDAGLWQHAALWLEALIRPRELP